jgi:uncharacterized protein with GYD domain
MRSYVILANWTDQGAKNSRDTLKRAKAFRALIESRGGKLVQDLQHRGGRDRVAEPGELALHPPVPHAALSVAILITSLRISVAVDGRRGRRRLV